MSELKIEHIVTNATLTTDRPFTYFCRCGRSGAFEAIEEHLDAEQIRSMRKALMDGRPIWIAGRMFDPFSK
jgi:hypothetical protein